MTGKLSSLFIAAILTAALPAAACINQSGTNNQGEFVRPLGYAGKRLEPYLRKEEDKAVLADWTREVTAKVRKSPSFNNLIDLSAILIRNDRFAEAVDLLQFLERKYPGRFQTASNMGTAYELLGKNEEALKWISEGLKRNPADHLGTEWLHVEILKAKLGQLPKPARGRSILNLDFGEDAMPRRPSQLPPGNGGKALSLYELGQALRYQLIERIKFVDPPEPMVAALLLDWANLELLAGTVESAEVLYDAAIRFGSKEKRIIAVRKAQAEKILAAAKTKPARSPGSCELCEPPVTAQATPLQPNSR